MQLTSYTYDIIVFCPIMSKSNGSTLFSVQPKSHFLIMHTVHIYFYGFDAGMACFSSAQQSNILYFRLIGNCIEIGMKSLERCVGGRSGTSAFSMIKLRRWWVGVRVCVQKYNINAILARSKRFVLFTLIEFMM